MMGMDIGTGFFGWIWMLLFWVALILLAIWLVGLIFPTARKSGEADKPLPASEILKLRFARGELTQEQYQEMLSVLRES
ncbi:MAG TPA: SHOCT domain-containing protein [Anaerolineae bacterium]|jgi:putative membrane protein